MDAVKFLEEAKRMCESRISCNGKGKVCPIYDAGNDSCIGTILSFTEADKLIEIVNAVEEWSAAHPRKTRSSEFLKNYPNASIFNNEAVNICPKLIDKDYNPSSACCVAICLNCKTEYWMQEVE